MARTFVICDQILHDAGLRAGDVDAVFLAGGTTLLPTVRNGASHYFGAPVRVAYDPMEVVSIGASVSRPDN